MGASRRANLLFQGTSILQPILTTRIGTISRLSPLCGYCRTGFAARSPLPAGSEVALITGQRWMSGDQEKDARWPREQHFLCVDGSQS